jgi:hypothetical protein
MLASAGLPDPEHAMPSVKQTVANPLLNRASEIMTWSS